jgi:hypothetical protein
MKNDETLPVLRYEIRKPRLKESLILSGLTAIAFPLAVGLFAVSVGLSLCVAIWHNFRAMITYPFEVRESAKVQMGLIEIRKPPFPNKILDN